MADIAEEKYEKHPHLSPGMEDDSVSRAAYTDHALVSKGRDRRSAWWRNVGKGLFEYEERDPQKRSEHHFFDVFGAAVDPETGRPKPLSTCLKDSFHYGEEKARRIGNFVAGMLQKSKERMTLDKLDRDFDWDAGRKPDPAPERGPVFKMGNGAAEDGNRMWANSPQMNPPDRAAIAQTKALPAPAKAVAPTKALAAPLKALPAPPKALPKPKRPRGDDQR